MCNRQCFKTIVLFFLYLIFSQPIIAHTSCQGYRTYARNIVASKSNNFSNHKKTKDLHLFITTVLSQKENKSLNTAHYYHMLHNYPCQKHPSTISPFKLKLSQQKQPYLTRESKLEQKPQDPNLAKLHQKQQLTTVSPAISKLNQIDDGKDRTGSFAITQISGKQLWIERGRYYDINRVAQDIGKKIHLHRILFYKSPNGRSWVGQPFLQKLRVIATVLEHHKGEKIKILKHKPKKRYRKLLGHRQLLTRIKIEEIEELETENIVPSSIESWLSHLPIYSIIKSINKLKHPRLNSNILKSNLLLPIENENIFSNFDPILNEILIKNVLYN